MSNKAMSVNLPDDNLSQNHQSIQYTSNNVTPCFFNRSFRYRRCKYLDMRPLDVCSMENRLLVWDHSSRTAKSAWSSICM